MAWSYVTLVIQLWILKTTGQDTQVTCIISERCILPCSIEPHGGIEVIHWYHTKNSDNPVHSYYHGKDQLKLQDKAYSGRTSLFTDKISSGNVSLSLTGVKTQDEGRYKCYTSTKNGNDEQFVKVVVEGSFKSVDITVVSDKLTCSSEGLYPAPTLTWSTDPPSPIQPEKAPETQQNAQGLFSIASSVQKTSDSTYICTVTAGHITRTSSLKQQSLSAKGGEALVIPCSVPGPNTNLKDFTLTWLFNKDTVLTFDGQVQMSKTWRHDVKYAPQETTIKLLKPLSGTFSCEVVTTEFRHFEQTEVLLQSGRGSGGTHPAAIAVPVAVVIVGLVIVGIVVLQCKRKAKQKSETDKKDHESQRLNNSNQS
ncbi:V-set domain-containing T-cell activation inhibitor 1-like isoform X2 [Sardina pilchardus]|uniref:V-set domain-containing T-cell activation inhibitor 1-like isoform X2 n=1 Tax=Sardina pilchardus TaxID=27697 RepID=UPI002E11464D